MVEVARAEPRMRREVEAFLEGFGALAQVPAQEWRRSTGLVLDGLFRQHWDPDGFPGLVVLDQGRVQGFLGTLFSRRPGAEPASGRLCNLTQWFVEERHRGLSLQLISSALALPDTSLASFRPTPELAEFLQRLGFQRLGSQVTLVFTAAVMGARLPPEVTLTVGEDAVAARLEGAARALLEDHRQLPDCVYLLLEQGPRRCLVLATREPHSLVIRVHHVSDPSLLAAHARGAVAALVDAARGGSHAFYLGTLIEARVLGGVPLGIGVDTTHEDAGLPAPLFLARPGGVGPSALGDNLYSELVLAGS